MVFLIRVGGCGIKLLGGKQVIVGIIVIPRDSVVVIVTKLNAGYPKHPGSIFSVSMEILERTTIAHWRQSNNDSSLFLSVSQSP